jgi:hypothetical protein
MSNSDNVMTGLVPVISIIWQSRATVIEIAGS